MNWYRDYASEWKEAIETVARELRRAETMVEKDTIQSMFLFELSKTTLPFAFKGGTSASKCFSIIDRFSEDIDLSMTRKITASEKKDAKEEIIRIAEGLGMILDNPDKIRSRYDYNKYEFKYPSLFNDALPEIIVETSFYQTAYPVKMQNVGSFVGKFCKDNNIEMPMPFEAADFEMNVQTIERTFIDKVFAVCDYRIQDMQDRDSRHLYDICKIMKIISLDKTLDDLIDVVRNDRMRSNNNPSAQLEHNIPGMLKEIIQSRFYENDYNSVTKKLLYEDMDYDFVVENGIKIVADSDVFIYKLKQQSHDE